MSPAMPAYLAVKSVLVYAARLFLAAFRGCRLVRELPILCCTVY